MSKQDQLIEYIILDIVDMITEEVFEKLQDKETGLYCESSSYVYDLFCDELNFGHIVQAEI